VHNKCCGFVVFVVQLVVQQIHNKSKYRVRQVKVIPSHVLLISEQQIGIFTRKFTRLFLIRICI